MTTWHTFPYFLGATLALWALATVPRLRSPALWVSLGTLVLAAFIAGFWAELDRPPMRTLGETRLWFGLLLPCAGLLIYRFVPWRWGLIYSCGVAALFLIFTAINSETHDRTLMPALQSAWFVPHVVLYLIAYAFLIYAGALALWGVARPNNPESRTLRLLAMVETSLWIGFSFLTLGLLAGAVWAKGAWGHYWTWDPKETWAFLTWAAFLAYFHLRRDFAQRPRAALLLIAGASVIVLICWFGVNYLPSASQSVHTYTQ